VKPRLLSTLLGLCLCAFTPGCGPVEALNTTVDTRGLVLRRDIAYGPAPRQAMDVWAPEGATALPVMVFFYGGSWQRGSRADYRFVAAELARRGFVVVVPDYRVSPDVPFPVFIEDGAAAVALTRREAPAWGGDPRRVVLMGHSAGAHIAAMLALDPRWLAAASDSRDAIAGMIGIAGPYDFLPLQDADIKRVFAAAADLRDTQPITFADGHAPPLLLLHGADDRVVLPRNSERLATRVQEAGGRATLRIYPNVGHVGVMLGFAPLFRSWSPVLDDTARFAADLPARPG